VIGITAAPGALRHSGPASERMVRSLSLKEKIMSKTNVGYGTKNQQDRELQDEELDAVNGGGGFSAVDVQAAPITSSPTLGVGVGGGGGGALVGSPFNIHFKN
jgi:hypothetical protein